jgi:hypothetical protein
MTDFRDPVMVENILNGFPGPIVLLPSRKKWLSVIILSACFGVLSLFISFGGDPARAARTTIIFRSVFAAFFGLLGLKGIIVLLPGMSSLRLGGDGLYLTYFKRTRRFSWTEAQNFVAGKSYAGPRCVAFDLAKSGRIILPDTYGLEAEDLSGLLNEWRNLRMAPIKGPSRRV